MKKNKFRLSKWKNKFVSISLAVGIVSSPLITMSASGDPISSSGTLDLKREKYAKEFNKKKKIVIVSDTENINDAWYRNSKYFYRERDGGNIVYSSNNWRKNDVGKIVGDQITTSFSFQAKLLRDMIKPEAGDVKSYRISIRGVNNHIVHDRIAIFEFDRFAKKLEEASSSNGWHSVGTFEIEFSSDTRNYEYLDAFEFHTTDSYAGEIYARFYWKLNSRQKWDLFIAYKFPKWDKNNKQHIQGNFINTYYGKAIHEYSIAEVKSTPTTDARRRVNIDDFLKKNLAKQLADAKDEAIAYIHNLEYPTRNDLVYDVKKFFNIQEARGSAIRRINLASKVDQVIEMASSQFEGTELEKVQATINAYTGSEGKNPALGRAKIKAKEFIESLTYPTKDDLIYDNDLFDDIQQAKKAALSKIDSASTAQQVVEMVSSRTSGTELRKVREAIDNYKNSKELGSDPALGRARITAKNFIESLTYPTRNDLLYRKDIFWRIYHAKKAALRKIDKAKVAADITNMVSSRTSGTELRKVQEAIDNYKNSIGSNPDLGRARITAKKFIKGLTYPVKDDLIYDKDLFDDINQAKQAALSKIDSASTAQQVAEMASSPSKGTELIKVQEAIDNYKNSKGSNKVLTHAKNKAKEFIKGLTYPAKDDLIYNKDLFDDINQAKQAALSEIDLASTAQQVVEMVSSRTSGTELEKIQKAIDNYKNSKGSDPALGRARIKAKEFIEGLTYPAKDDLNYDSDLFDNINQAKQAALSKIDSASTAQQVAEMASSPSKGTELIKVQEAIDAYTDSTGIIEREKKLLQDAKDKAEAIIKSWSYPALADPKQDNDLYDAIDKAIKAALREISGAWVVQDVISMVSSKTEGTEIKKIIDAIDKYVNSLGARGPGDPEALEKAKNAAKAIINGLDYPSQDNARYDKSKFAAIGLAKTAALSVINKAKTPEAANAMASSKTIGTEVQKVLAAIKAYTDSTGTDVANAKTKAKAIINGLDYPAQDDARHDKNKFAAIGIAQKEAIRAIDGATTTSGAATMASSPTTGTEVKKVLAKIKIYKDSTGTIAAKAEALENAKTKAKAIINGLVYPAQDDARHDKNKFAAIGLAKTAALSQINGAATPEAATAMASSSTEGTEVEKVLAKIKIYTDSTGTDAEALENAKTKAKAIINGLVYPAQDDARHDKNKFAAIGLAKTAALSQINGAATPEAATAMASSSTEGTEVEKVLAKIKIYTDSTGTDAEALENAKTKAKAIINGLVYPAQDDARHDKNKFAAIGLAKTAALSQINGAATPEAATAMASSSTEGTEVEKVLAKIKIYTDSTGTDAEALENAKTKAKAIINGLVYPAQDDARHDKNKFAAIGLAKTAALSQINGAATPEAATAMASSSTEGTEVEKVLAKIKIYTDSTGTDAEALENAKTKAKAIINGLVYPAQDDARHDKNKFAAIGLAKTAALSQINGAATPEAATAMASSSTEGTEVEKVLAKIKIYTDSTGTDAEALENAKTKAKAIINGLVYPAQDDARHDKNKFAAIGLAKTAALSQINGAATPEAATAMASSSTEGTEVEKVLAKIKIYTDSTGTIAAKAEALENAKTKAKAIINGLVYPAQDDARHDKNKFAAIGLAKTAALSQINGAATPEAATAMASSSTEGTEVEKVLAKIKIYTDSTGTDAEALENAKTKAKAIINGLVYPAQDDARHDKNKFAAIGLAKTAALSQINGAATPEAATAMASSSTEGTEVEKVLAKIKIYTDSTGTDAEALENAKTKAKAIINGLVYPAQDDARHDKNKFAAIGLAKTAALSQINGAATPEAATAMASSSTEGTEVEKVLAKIKIYTDSTGTDAEALENAKTKAKAIINGLVYPAQDDARHDKNKFAAIGLAKTAALSQINGAATPEAATAMASSSTEGTEVEKVLAKIKIYTDSTGTDAEALENAKTKAKAIINGLVYPAQDDARHDKNKFAAIGLAKTAALSQINGAATPEAATAMASSSTEGTEVEKVLAKIKIYTDSTGTDAEALENAKTKAKAIINGLVYPAQDDARHDKNKFAAIGLAKTAALSQINGAATPEAATAMASSSTEGTEVEKVLAKIKIYTDSTGTDAEALENAKTKAKAIINGLVYPAQDDARHDKNKFAAIGLAKTAALSQINGAATPEAATAMASSSTEGTEVEKVLAKIKIYTDSTGTDAEEAAKQQVVDEEKARIEKLEKITIDRSSSIDKDSLKMSDLSLSDTVEDATYEITHDEFTANGDYEVSVKTTKDGKESIAKRKIEIKGITSAASIQNDETENNESNKKTTKTKKSGLSKGAIAGIIIGSILGIGIISFFAMQFIRNKKKSKLD